MSEFNRVLEHPVDFGELKIVNFIMYLISGMHWIFLSSQNSYVETQWGRGGN
jgi:hypothetical protein